MRSDKGGNIVIMSQESYHLKMMELLENQDEYEVTTLYDIKRKQRVYTEKKENEREEQIKERECWIDNQLRHHEVLKKKRTERAKSAQERRTYLEHQRVQRYQDLQSCKETYNLQQSTRPLLEGIPCPTPVPHNSSCPIEIRTSNFLMNHPFRLPWQQKQADELCEEYCEPQKTKKALNTGRAWNMLQLINQGRQPSKSIPNKGQYILIKTECNSQPFPSPTPLEARLLRDRFPSQYVTSLKRVRSKSAQNMYYEPS
ncbi:uncharacterized protein LOC122806206 [Protopterus annectens]|uniref:uncharacterized protein LOC122806206 n=1 Tax=Protopterus annectens TaxID=7888 RepID=UPI001CFB7C00|nr:uncharacterized protein LOC122806206 [Protopterus annectens]